MVPGTQHTSLGLGQCLGIGIAYSLVDIVDDQILAHDVRIDIGIEVVVCQEGTLGLFVEGEVDAVERAVLVADNVRLLGPCIVAQHVERRHIIAAHGIDDELVVL